MVLQRDDDEGCLVDDDMDSMAKHLARRLVYVSSSSAHLLRNKLFSSSMVQMMWKEFR